ncbi:hypothetical protein SLE2022_242270 [Rubroshorea leprosula]
MADGLFSFSLFDFSGIQGCFSLQEDMVINGKHQGVFGGREIVGEFNSICFECGGLNLVEEQDHNSLRKEQEIKSEDLISEELSFGYGFTNDH